MFSLILCITFYHVNAQTVITDLSGEWEFALDPTNSGEREEWFGKTLPNTIKLPGSTDENGYGISHISGKTLENGKPEIWQLARKHTYIGPAWYQKKITISCQNAGDNQYFLSLERCMWQTKLWVNGKYIGERHSLCTPHKYNLSPALKTGENTLTLKVDNSPFVYLGSWSHGYSAGIQSIWNGMIGKLVIESYSPVSLKEIQCYPSFSGKKIKIKTTLSSTFSKEKNGTLLFNITDKTGNSILKIEKKIKINPGNTTAEFILDVPNNIQSWDEFSPILYTLNTRLNLKNYNSEKQIKIGFRDFTTRNGDFYINDHKTFLRGEHDAGSFPLTGYPSMNKEEWIKIFETGKSYGFNHWRFHSWCPPKAAFEAADELGIYLQPELPLFSQIQENTLIGNDAKRDKFLYEELQGILDEYGNHPSFVLMSMGNELKGDTATLKKWVRWSKLHDNRHLYASNSNLEAMGLYFPLSEDDFSVAHAAKVNNRRTERRMARSINSEKPNTKNNYSHTLLPPYDKHPVIVHELGQWSVFPDFKEIKKYSGVFLPRNLEVFKTRLEQKGMSDMADKFLLSSGKLSALLYKEEIERCLRTPGLDGFQLLDLRDYQAQGSALIGLLNAFWESKGLVTPEEFRSSCNAVSILLQMEKRTWQNNENFIADVVIPNYSPKELNNVEITWEVSFTDKNIASGQLTDISVKQGSVGTCGKIEFPLQNISEATQMKIEIAIKNTDIKNKYDIWVYPHVLPEDKGNIIIATETNDSLLQQIKNGANVLLIPKDLNDREKMTFATPFWSTILFDYQPKTMGIYCDPKHPIFKYFPTDSWSNWQWWELTQKGYCARLNHTDASYRPILQVIDHPVRNDKLGAIMEARIGMGKLLVCTIDISSKLQTRPVARQLRYSILQYMKSPEFMPQENDRLVTSIFSEKSNLEYKRLSTDNDSSEFPVMFAFDNDEKSYWEIKSPDNKPISVNIELARERYITGCRLNVPEGEIKDFSVIVSPQKIGKKKTNLPPAIKGDGTPNKNWESELWDNGFTVQNGRKGKFIQIKITPVSGQTIHLKEFSFIFGD